MRTATKQRLRVDQLDSGDWLYRLLADMHEEIARYPSPKAVERIRRRLLIQMKAPAKAAA